MRNAVELLNLSRYADHSDLLTAECIRTFPSVSFQASTLLKREEIETMKVVGASVIATVHHCGGNASRSYLDLPFDLLYGFRGDAHDVDLLSPYEMLLH